MTKQSILIVDDEEAILTLFKRALMDIGDGVSVDSARDGYTALVKTKQNHFDLVITDYKMVGMNGLELLQAIHKLKPETRVILMTGYGNDTIEAEARRLMVSDYLTKPIDLNVLKEVVRNCFQEMPVMKPGIHMLSEQHYSQVNQLLTQLQEKIGARCIFLTNSEGHLLVRLGETQNLPLEQIASLIGGSMATLVEAGRVIDGESETINLAYREGKTENLYAINVGYQWLMIIVTERGLYSSRLGSVWYYAQQTALDLLQELQEQEVNHPQNIIAEDLTQAIDEELDKLLMEVSPKVPIGIDQSESNSDHIENAEIGTELSEQEKTEEEVVLLNFEEAIATGLISNSLSDFLRPKGLSNE